MRSDEFENLPDRSWPSTRRRFLAVTGTAAALGLAGCSSGDGGDPGDGSGGSSGSSGGGSSGGPADSNGDASDGDSMENDDEMDSGDDSMENDGGMDSGDDGSGGGSGDATGSPAYQLEIVDSEAEDEDLWDVAFTLANKGAAPTGHVTVLAYWLDENGERYVVNGGQNIGSREDIAGLRAGGTWEESIHRHDADIEPTDYELEVEAEDRQPAENLAVTGGELVTKEVVDEETPALDLTIDISAVEDWGPSSQIEVEAVFYDENDVVLSGGSNRRIQQKVYDTDDDEWTTAVEIFDFDSLSEAEDAIADWDIYMER